MHICCSAELGFFSFLSAENLSSILSVFLLCQAFAKLCSAEYFVALPSSLSSVRRQRKKILGSEEQEAQGP